MPSRNKNYDMSQRNPTRNLAFHHIQYVDELHIAKRVLTITPLENIMIGIGVGLMFYGDLDFILHENFGLMIHGNIGFMFLEVLD